MVDNDGHRSGACSRYGVRLVGLHGRVRRASPCSRCADANRFFEQSSSRADLCRVNSFYEALFTAIDPDATDTEIRRACDSSACRDRNAADLGTAFGSCGPPPANCRASVGETAACVNDTLARYHQLASAVPDCGSISRASLETMDLGSIAMAQFSDVPAACVVYQTKCGGTSPEVVSFAEEFLRAARAVLRAGGPRHALRPESAGAGLRVRSDRSRALPRRAA